MDEPPGGRIDIDRFFHDHLYPCLYIPWKGRGEGILNIISREYSRVCPHLGDTLKSIQVTIEGWENQVFLLSLEEVKLYPPLEPNFNPKCTDGSNVIDCIRYLLLNTWQATRHGRLSIASKKHRNKIEVLVGEMPSYRFLVDRDRL